MATEDCRWKTTEESASQGTFKEELLETMLPRLSKTSQEPNPRNPNTRRRTKNNRHLPGDTCQQVNFPTPRPLDLRNGICANTCELAEVRATMFSSSSSTTRSKAMCELRFSRYNQPKIEVEGNPRGPRTVAKDGRDGEGGAPL